SRSPSYRPPPDAGAPPAEERPGHPLPGAPRTSCRRYASGALHGSEETSAGGESFPDLPVSCLCTGRTGRQNREEAPMMVTGIVVIGALLVGACAWHLTRRYKSRH